MPMITIGLIGYGYWGPNLLRNVTSRDDCTVSWCADINTNALSTIRKRYPSIKTTTDYRDILNDPTVDAVIIATPVKTHFAIGQKALRAGKDVLIEKPLADSYTHALRLVEEADKTHSILMVDHTFIYTPAIRRVKEYLTQKKLGSLLYIDSVRISLGLFQNDTNVIFDLATHDFAIYDYLLGIQPSHISAIGASHFKNTRENLAYIVAQYENNFITHNHVSWLSPVKVRTMTISGKKRMLLYDDLQPSEKLRLYDKGVTVERNPQKIKQAKFGYRSGDMLVPNIEVKEALSSVADHFIHCIETRSTPYSDGEAGARVVKLVETATQSLRKGGKVLKVK